MEGIAVIVHYYFRGWWRVKGRKKEEQQKSVFLMQWAQLWAENVT